MKLFEICFQRLERERNTNTLTGLPNKTQLDNELSNLIQQNKTFAAVYIDIDNLSAFNKVYGFAKGDRAIQILGETINEAVRLFGSVEDLAAHISGDDFVVLTTSVRARMLCPRIIRDFDSRIRALYNQRHLERGYIEYEGWLGQMEQCPVMTLSIIVITNERRVFSHHLQVHETASQLIGYLKGLPGSNYYVDNYENAMETYSSLAERGIPKAHQDELKTLQRVLRWISSLSMELEAPTLEMKECLDSLKSFGVRNLVPEQRSKLVAIEQNIKRLLYAMGELANLTQGEWVNDGVTIREVDLQDIFTWIIDQVGGQAEKQGVGLDIKGLEDIDTLMVDESSLRQGVFHLLRSEIGSSRQGDQLIVRVSNVADNCISIEITNPNGDLRKRELSILSQDQFEDIPKSRRTNGFYMAKVLIQSIGGKTSVTSEKGEGITYTISIPKRWRSSIEEVDALLSSAEYSRQEARTQLQNIRHILSSMDEQVPSAIEGRLENLGNRIQEIMVFCNRSLFLASELNSQLEKQQDRFLKREVEQLAISEVLVVANKSIAESSKIDCLFDLESARRVATNSLSIASEFHLTRNERQVLYQAALFKDLALALSPEDMVERRVVSTIDEAYAVKDNFSMLWNELSRLDFLSQAFELLSYIYERHDRTGRPAGVIGNNIPLRATILSVVDTFESLTSGLTSGNSLSPEKAIQEIFADSGRRFDSNVLSALLKIWRREGLQIVSSESRSEKSIR